MQELMEKWPRLATTLPRRSLATLPTPVRRLDGIVDGARLWCKDDGRSGSHYGGNKVRKLELLLARALEQRCRKVITFGYAGSNHAAATAVYARECGLRSISMLLPQAPAPYVARNLAVSVAAGAELHLAATPARLAAATAAVMARHGLLDRRLPAFIPPGGSSPAGTVGFVAAALELAEQIRRGELPPPVAIYVAAGTLGSAVGLAVGLAAAELAIPVVAVRVAEARYVNDAAAHKLFAAVVALLRGAAPDFPPLALSPAMLRIRHDCFGRGYAVPTDAGNTAVARAAAEGLALDPTYTGKTLAALLHDVETRTAPDGPLLFWNTYNSVDLAPLADDIGPADVPAPFAPYLAGANGA
jgi:1-aminocyclopropane-1-carboxylate deaminase/D-cysteine desulfhydrase-like pyridoxal-dependent ACC family enzyme